MQKLFLSVSHLDTHCYEHYHLSEDLLMEHAAVGMANYIKETFVKYCSIFIVCGAGNNGADGIALARLLHPLYDIKLYLPFGVKTKIGMKQLERIQALGISTVEAIAEADIIVDALFGSGLNRAMDAQSCEIISQLNHMSSYKIACDIPSGIMADGSISDVVFQADITMTMGALKWALFSDNAKDFVGDIDVVSLGVDRSLYEGSTHKYLLEREDMRLPHRTAKNAHKGHFGHCAVISGEKEGAAVLSGLAAMEFGAGLVTLIAQEEKELPAMMMQSSALPKNTTAICAGMGLGSYYDTATLRSLLLDHEIPMVLDADILTQPLIKELLHKEIVITPHPKEFCALLSQIGLAEISVETLQKERMHYARVFSNAYPHVVLLLKGANVIIAYEERYYINPYGSAKLSKGGSGDVLSGLIGALIAQHYPLLEATISASLAHVFATELIEKNSYAITPKDIIKKIGKL